MVKNKIVKQARSQEKLLGAHSRSEQAVAGVQGLSPLEKNIHKLGVPRRFLVIKK
jgi:hypothetical protein